MNGVTSSSETAGGADEATEGGLDPQPIIVAAAREAAATKERSIAAGTGTGDFVALSLCPAPIEFEVSLLIEIPERAKLLACLLVQLSFSLFSAVSTHRPHVQS